ncbi:MAG: hypothetical protein JXA46_18940 [Dehalococcoidales bacterium]|nr:hypothetical protein [Dehalococcoidales bacterium]
MEEQPVSTREQKREKRLKDYISPPGVAFRDARAERLYGERVKRLLAAGLCEKPDRVPVSLPLGHYPAYHAGYDFKKVMYDYRAAREAWTRFMWDFYEDMDSYSGPGLVFSGKVFDILDYHQYSWPGHGVADTVNTYQFNEKEYMSAAEYDRFIDDPGDFGFRVLTPRTIGAAEPWQYFPHLTSLNGMPMAAVYPFMRPDVRESFRKFIAAGEELERQQQEFMIFGRECLEAGFPAGRIGMGSAPFDLIADNLRGTAGAAKDMYRQPEKLLEAINIATDIHIARLIESMNAVNGYMVMFPLHKGDDVFMSRRQFEKFYWPGLKKVINALIEEGIMVSLFAEGSHNQRLEYYGDFPKGWVSWMFDRTDMALAKKTIGDNCCISGNVPASLMVSGTPGEVKECCRKLIETCAPGGGYILAGGCSATETRDPDNFRAFMQAAEEYGRY